MEIPRWAGLDRVELIKILDRYEEENERLKSAFELDELQLIEELRKSDKAFSALKSQHASADVELVNLKARLKELEDSK